MKPVIYPRHAALLLGLFGAALLAACGSREALSLKPGMSAPPAAYGREFQPTAAELLETPTLAIPDRSVELRTRSEPREDDPFDLPPPENAADEPGE
jgi:hypothetical protein